MVATKPTILDISVVMLYNRYYIIKGIERGGVSDRFEFVLESSYQDLDSDRCGLESEWDWHHRAYIAVQNEYINSEA